MLVCEWACGSRIRDCVGWSVVPVPLGDRGYHQRKSTITGEGGKTDTVSVHVDVRRQGADHINHPSRLPPPHLLPTVWPLIPSRTRRLIIAFNFPVVGHLSLRRVTEVGNSSPLVSLPSGEQSVFSLELFGLSSMLLCLSS